MYYVGPFRFFKTCFNYDRLDINKKRYAFIHYVDVKNVSCELVRECPCVFENTGNKTVFPFRYIV